MAHRLCAALLQQHADNQPRGPAAGFRRRAHALPARSGHRRHACREALVPCRAHRSHHGPHRTRQRLLDRLPLGPDRWARARSATLPAGMLLKTVDLRIRVERAGRRGSAWAGRRDDEYRRVANARRRLAAVITPESLENEQPTGALLEVLTELADASNAYSWPLEPIHTAASLYNATLTGRQPAPAEQPPPPPPVEAARPPPLRLPCCGALCSGTSSSARRSTPRGGCGPPLPPPPVAVPAAVRPPVASGPPPVPTVLVPPSVASTATGLEARAQSALEPCGTTNRFQSERIVIEMP
ncbi:hypothetical protein U1Q18_051578 [Sarracenia purpurea var. burkii]